MSLLDFYIQCNNEKRTDDIIADVPEDLSSLMCHIAVNYVQTSSRHLNLTEEQINAYEDQVYKIMNLGNLCRAIHERYLLEGRYHGDINE